MYFSDLQSYFSERTFQIKQNNNEILVTIPFSFYQDSQSSTVYINKISQYGKI